MESLPFELILCCVLELSFPDLLNLSSTCHYYNEIIGENDLFWKLKFQSRFHLRLDPDERTWKERCRSYGRIHEYSRGDHKIISSHRAKQVSGSLFLDFDNNLWSYSSLLKGSIAKISSTDISDYLLTQSGEVLYRGTNVNTGLYVSDWVPLNFPVKIVDISSGLDHLLGLDGQGMVWGWGQNTFNHLGENDEVYKIPKQITNFTVKKIIAADYVSALITSDDELWVGGISRSGEISSRHRQGFYFVQKGVQDVGLTSQDMFILTIDNHFKRSGHTRYTSYNNHINIRNKGNYTICFDNRFLVLLDNFGRVQHYQGMDKNIVPAIQVTRFRDSYIILER